MATNLFQWTGTGGGPDAGRSLSIFNREGGSNRGGFRMEAL
jgi:hypothetical protein